MRVNPDYAEAHNNLGSVYGQQGRTEEAIHEFQVALQINPECAVAHCGLGVAYGRQGRTEEAIQEYQRYIMQDAALERRFQQVWVPEPRPDEALEMLRGVKARYEAHHGVVIADEALAAAVKLSVGWLPDRHLPVPQGARSPGRSLRPRPDSDDQQAD